MMSKKADQYIKTWMDRGYAGDIPDEVPAELMALQVAPSYKAICLAILRNDHAMTSLGFSVDGGDLVPALKAAMVKDQKQMGFDI